MKEIRIEGWMRSLNGQKSLSEEEKKGTILESLMIKLCKRIEKYVLSVY